VAVVKAADRRSLLCQRFTYARLESSEFGASFEKAAEIGKSMLHEAHTPTAGAPVAVLGEEGRENIFFDGWIGSDRCPRLAELVEMSGEEPRLDFLDGRTADEFGAVLGFQVSKEGSPAYVVAVGVRQEKKEMELRGVPNNGWKFIANPFKTSYSEIAPYAYLGTRFMTFT
jgi:hypothetical protein